MLKKSFIFLLLSLLALQLIGVERTNPPVDETLTLKAPSHVEKILKRSCYDCHSFETTWPYYSSIAPVSFFVSSHVKNARKALNFSLWNSMDEKIKKRRLKRAIITTNNERMALPSYVLAHEDAKLNENEKKILTSWFEAELARVNENTQGKL